MNPTLNAPPASLADLLSRIRGSSASIGELPPAFGVADPMAAPMDPMTPIPAAPPPAPTRQDSSLARALKAIVPLVFAGIAAKTGGPRAAAGALEGFTAVTRAREERARQEAEQAALATREQNTQDYRLAQLAQEAQRRKDQVTADFLRNEVTPTLEMPEASDPAWRARALQLLDERGQSLGLPKGYIITRAGGPSAAKLAEAAAAQLTLLDSQYPGVDVDNMVLDAVPPALARMGVKADASGRLPVTHLRALAGLALTDPETGKAPARTTQPATTYQVREVLLPNGQRGFANYDPKRGIFVDDNGKKITGVRPVPPAASRNTNDHDLSPLVNAVLANPAAYDDLTPSVRTEILPALLAKGFTGFGKKLSDSAITKISDARSAISSLRDLRTTLQENEQFIGPLAGLQALNPYSDARKAQAKIDAVRQRVGKALEGGVLRKEDEAKYKNILAKLTDVPSTAIYKVDNMIDSLQRDLDTFVKTQDEAGRRPLDTGSSQAGVEEWVRDPKSGALVKKGAR